MYRRGVTLVELILFLAIASIMGLALMPLLFSSTENRLLQESVAHIENNGSQLMQVFATRVHESEKILDPLPGTSSKVLALQMSSGSLSPTIYGLLTGAIIQIEGTVQQTISASEVSVQDFLVRNFSNGQSTGVTISFKLTRALRLEAPRYYTQTFQSSFTAFPKNTLTGNTCGFALPGCGTGNRYNWQICNPNVANAYAQMDCH